MSYISLFTQLITIWLLFSAPFSHAERYRLYVDADPPDARVRIMNINPRFYQGIPLKPGSYDIMVDKEGYRSYRRWIQIKDQDYHLPVNLKLKEQAAEESEEYTLVIHTLPEEAQVHFINKGIIFKQEMSLPPGEYEIKVFHEGYQTVQETISITDHDISKQIELEKTAQLLAEEGTAQQQTQQPSSDSTTQPQPTDSQPSPLEPTTRSAEEKRDKFLLEVNTIPLDAKIEILNLKRPFKQGMALSPGKYLLRVSKPGFVPRREWVTVIGENVSTDVVLSPPPACFFLAEEQKKADQHITKFHSMTVLFYDNFVKIEYYHHRMEYHRRQMLKSTSDTYKFQGIKEDGTLTLIGVVDYDGQEEELKTIMLMREDELVFTMDGKEHVLQQVRCRKDRYQD